ncbi:MAG TPA: hypothetical protein VK038_07525, partial [Ornithinicoccus sp.]|nr:hypothetical protein [Ornithinicoccus sp.]
LAHAGGGAATLTVTVTSESDPSATRTITVDVQVLLLGHASATLQQLVDDGALPNGVAQKMTAWMNQVVDATRKGKVKQAEMALDRIEGSLSEVTDPDARQTLQDLVNILRQS